MVFFDELDRFSTFLFRVFSAVSDVVRNEFRSYIDIYIYILKHFWRMMSISCSLMFAQEIVSR